MAPTPTSRERAHAAALAYDDNTYRVYVNYLRTSRCRRPAVAAPQYIFHLR